MFKVEFIELPPNEPQWTSATSPADARIAELEARLKEAEVREAKMRAILEGAGYDDLGDLDDTLTRDIEDCWGVGETIGDITRNHIEYANKAGALRDAAEARANRAEEENGRLRTACQNLVDAVARTRKADDAVSRNSGLTADWDEYEDAHASLIIFENAMLAALRAGRESEGR